MDERLKIVKPYGHLHTNNQDYYLIQPHPITSDSWEGDNCYRFLVVPAIPIAVEQRGNLIYHVYEYPRHIVTNSFVIEYNECLEIHIPISEEIIIERNLETKENDEETDDPYFF